MLDLYYCGDYISNDNDYVYFTFEIKQRTEFSKIEVILGGELVLKFETLDEMLLYSISRYFAGSIEWRDFCVNYLNDVFHDDYIRNEVDYIFSDRNRRLI